MLELNTTSPSLPTHQSVGCTLLLPVICAYFSEQSGASDTAVLGALRVAMGDTMVGAMIDTIVDAAMVDAMVDATVSGATVDATMFGAEVDVAAVDIAKFDAPVDAMLDAMAEDPRQR